LKSISQPAEECNRIPPASNNDQTPAESGLTPEDTSDRSQDKSGKRHSFSRTLAKSIQAKKRETNKKAKHGAHESLVLKYLAHRVRTSKKVVDGKKTFYMTVMDLALVFPYLGATTIYEILVRLEKLGCLELHNFNKRKYDRTFWYHVTKEVCNACEESVIYFASTVAAQVGVPAAVIFDNFQYWISDRKEKGLAETLNMSPTTLAEMLPFSIDTIKRGLKALEVHHIKKLSDTDPIYEMQESNSGANPNERGANPNDRGAYPNEIGAYPNNDTSYITISNPLETPSKEKTASFFSIPSPAENNDNEQVSSPSTGDISRVAEDVVGVWPHVDSLDGLHLINRSNASAGLLIENHPKHLAVFLDTVRELSTKVMSTFNEAELEKLYYSEDGEAILKAVLPKYHQLLDGSDIDPAGASFGVIYYGALECMVGAFLWPKETCDSYSHPIHCLIRVTYELHLMMWTMEEEKRQKEVDEYFAEQRCIHANPDADKEDDASLAPAEKTRVFRNALSSRNKVGWLDYLGRKNENLINIQSSGLKLIQKLFEHNPDASPADLLKIMDRCIAEYNKQPKPLHKYEPEIHWNSRTGATSVLWFAKLLKAIVRELHISDCPIENFLGDITREQEEQEDEEALAA